LAKKLIKKREEVKRKMEGEIRQEGAFSPITKRLKTVSDQLQNTDIKCFNNTSKNYNHYKKKSEYDVTRNITDQFSFG
jgi:hypothetical protein